MISTDGHENRFHADAGSLTLVLADQPQLVSTSGLKAGGSMGSISFKRHRFPGSVICQAVRWYFRFTLSIRDVEELMAERGIQVSREAIRCWVIKFGPLIAANLRKGRPSPTGRWHLDEAVVKIGGRRMYLWRAVDDEGEVLDVLVQRQPNKHAALELLRRMLRNTGVHPQSIVTDKLASYRAAMKVLQLQGRHRPGGMRENNRAENSHLVIRRRERKQQRSNRRNLPSAFFPPTVRSTTLSISSPT